MSASHSNGKMNGAAQTTERVPVSAVIACYKDADIVERNLAAFARQSYRDFELIIADDGSREDYRPLLERWAPRFEHPIQHVRHEDLGFRKTRVLNRAIFVSRFDRLIFVDMDCLPHPDFVRNHVRYLEPGGVLACRRVHVQRQDVPTPEQIWERGLNFGPLRLVSLWLRGRAGLIEHGIVLPVAYETGYRGILGSNFFCVEIGPRENQRLQRRVRGSRLGRHRYRLSLAPSGREDSNVASQNRRIPRGTSRACHQRRDQLRASGSRANPPRHACQRRPSGDSQGATSST